MSQEYWEAQIEGFEEEFKKPVWRDFLQTQRKLMDKVHTYFWVESSEE